MVDELTECFAGRKLWGDDFGPDEIRAWYEDEREGYALLGAGNRGQYSYGYHALNHRHGFSQLPEGRFHSVLGLGAAYGDEFLPIIDRIDAITILEASAALKSLELRGVPVRNVAPDPSGTLPFNDREFDLITALGVLHHIPNVTHVIGELHRCLRPGGYLLLREPIVSMGDWRKPRRGLTKRERGIPMDLLRTTLLDAGFSIRSERLTNFPALARLSQALGVRAPYNHPSVVALDALAASAFRWNLRYHAETVLHKLRPSSVYVVAARPAK